MDVTYTPRFMKKFNDLETELQDEIIEKIDQLKYRGNHLKLKVHKLKGRLKNQYSFSINYKIRATFVILKKDEMTMLDIGDHDIYKQT